jgi:hypothetical protein
MSDISQHPLEQLAATGPWDGPSYRYRGAEIHCCPGGHVCGLMMRDHPLNGATFGVVGTVTPLVDLWVDEGRLPHYIRQKPRL